MQRVSASTLNSPEPLPRNLLFTSASSKVHENAMKQLYAIFHESHLQPVQKKYHDWPTERRSIPDVHPGGTRKRRELKMFRIPLAGWINSTQVVFDTSISTIALAFDSPLLVLRHLNPPVKQLCVDPKW